VTLSSGARLGPYEIVSPLGAGGMGEVYRARDTRLGRDVAIKVLPEHLSKHPDARARFEREARAVSSLNHPHICTLHDVGREGATDFLVMEHLEGETLLSRLERGPVPLDEMLRVAIQIADALAAAHRSGVVHRDLKPGNVMLTKAGAKLLDFGLAKGLGPASASDLTASPTMTSPLTAAGTIVGTFQYMAPEQLAGKEADVRTDLWAFGAVLFEMATGKRAFVGETQATLIGAILHAEPPSLSQLQPVTPPALERLVKACLAKDPDDRWQSAGDLKRELVWIAAGTAVGEAAAPGSPGTAKATRTRERLAWGIAALLFAALAATLPPALTQLRGGRAPAHPVRLSLAVPEKSVARDPAISPDGTRVVVVVQDPTGIASLWLRPLDALEGEPLAGTNEASLPFWSPDGSAIAFFADGKLKRIPAAGGPVTVVCAAVDPRGGAWSPGGEIVFAPTPTGPLSAVSAAGGTPRQISALDATRDETTHRWPSFLPDGRRFLYLAWTAPRAENRAILVGSLDAADRRLLMAGDGAARYAPPGYLLFRRGTALFAQRFDASSLTLSGEPQAIADTIATGPFDGHAPFSVAAGGTLVYESGDERPKRLAWFDRAGSRLAPSWGIEEAFPSGLALSPDGKRLAFESDRGDVRNLWLLDLTRGSKTRLTFAVGGDDSPVWSPDGTRIAFDSRRSGEWEIYERAADGSGEDRLLPGVDSKDLWVTDWTDDGRYLLYTAIHEKTGADVWALPLFGDRAPIPIRATEMEERWGVASPDGRWVAYMSSESGRPEVFVEPFPGGGGRWQVSISGGSEPIWRGDGREIFFRSLDSRVCAVPVTAAGAAFDAGTPECLFAIDPTDVYLNTRNAFVVTADGQRFAAFVSEGGAPPSAVHVVLNWPAGLD